MKRRCRWWCEAVMCVLKENYIFCGDTKLLNVWTWSYIICGHEAMKPYCRCWYEALCFKCRWLRGHVTWRQWPRAGKPTIQLCIPLHSTLTAGAGNPLSVAFEVTDPADRLLEPLKCIQMTWPESDWRKKIYRTWLSEQPWQVKQKKLFQFPA